MSFAIVLVSPVTVADSRDKANSFRRSSILFRPPEPENIPKRRTPQWCFGGAAGYRPRVRSAYYERVYVHSSEEQPLYMRAVRESKEGNRQSGGILVCFPMPAQASAPKALLEPALMRAWSAPQTLQPPARGFLPPARSGLRRRRCRHLPRSHPQSGCAAQE